MKHLADALDPDGGKSHKPARQELDQPVLTSEALGLQLTWIQPSRRPAASSSSGGPMVSSKSRARATRAQTMASHTSSLANWLSKVFIGGEEREVGLQLRPGLLRLPEAPGGQGR